MIHSFNFFMALTLVAFHGITSFATPISNHSVVPAIHGVEDVSARSASTCADPTLASTVVSAFDGQQITHFLDFHYTFINTNTIESAGTTKWTLEGPAFKAWPTQQPFTFPLWCFTTQGSDYAFQVGVDTTTPPTMSGFGTPAILLWVYNSSVCGSVPLMCADFPARSDHYYTTDPIAHAGLLADGWTDCGVVAFVLPAY